MPEATSTVSAPSGGSSTRIWEALVSYSLHLRPEYASISPEFEFNRLRYAYLGDSRTDVETIGARDFQTHGGCFIGRWQAGRVLGPGPAGSSWTTKSFRRWQRCAPPRHPDRVSGVWETRIIPWEKTRNICSGLLDGQECACSGATPVARRRGRATGRRDGWILCGSRLKASVASPRRTERARERAGDRGCGVHRFGAGRAAAGGRAPCGGGGRLVERRSRAGACGGVVLRGRRGRGGARAGVRGGGAAGGGASGRALVRGRVGARTGARGGGERERHGQRAWAVRGAWRAPLRVRLQRRRAVRGFGAAADAGGLAGVAGVPVRRLQGGGRGAGRGDGPGREDGVRDPALRQRLRAARGVRSRRGRDPGLLRRRAGGGCPGHPRRRSAGARLRAHRRCRGGGAAGACVRRRRGVQHRHR